MRSLKGKDGITIIALIVTVIVLLILATVTIGTINGGITEYAKKAKEDTEKRSIITQIEEAYIIARDTGKTGKVTSTDMQKALNKTFKENVEVRDDDDIIIIRIGESYFELDNEGNVSER